MKSIFSNNTKAKDILKAIETTASHLEKLEGKAMEAQNQIDDAISTGKPLAGPLASLSKEKIEINEVKNILDRLTEEHNEAESREAKELLTSKFNQWKKNSTDEAGKIDKLLDRALSIAKDLQEIEQEASNGVESIISTAQEIGLKISLPGIPGGPMKAIYSRDFNARELVRAAGDYMVNVIGRASIDE